MLNKNIAIISAATGLTISLLFILAVTVLQTTPGPFHASHIGVGLLTCVACSMFNVTIYKSLRQGNDAGAFRNSSYIFSAALGAGLLSIFFAVDRHVNLSDTLGLVGRAIMSSLLIAIGIGVVLAICLIPVLLFETIFKIKIVSGKLFTEEVLGAAMTSIVIMVLWLSLVQNNLSSS